MAYNYGSKILNNAISALHVQQAVIANTGNNIANVDTEGYTRRVVQIQNQAEDNSAGLRIGNGVEVGEIQRYSDEFIEGKLRNAISGNEQASVEDDLVSQIEKLFNLTDDAQTIGSTLTAFYSAIDDLSVNPSSIELRNNLLESAKTLVSSLQSTYNTVASLQDELDARISNEVNTVNSITKSIADLNLRISALERSGLSVAYDERDQRDVLLKDLAEKIDFDLVESSDGSVTVSLSNGFSLVHAGYSHELTVANSLNGENSAESLSGGSLSYIIYDYSNGAGTGEINLTDVIGESSGSIAGMLQVRGLQSKGDDSPFDSDGYLVDVATRIESITRNLLTKFNETYLGSDPQNGNFSGDLDGNNPSTFGFFTFQGAGDLDGDGIPTNADLDSAVTGISSYTRYLNVAINSGRQIAAAYGEEVSAGVYEYASGDSRNLEKLSSLKSESLSFSVPEGNNSYSFTGTFEQSYNEMVNYVGNLRARTMVNQTVSEDKYTSVLNQHDQVSAVSLDEEYTKLITAQQSYQASARMIKIAQEMFDDIIAMYY